VLLATLFAPLPARLSYDAQMRFPAPWDRTLRIVTTVAIAAMLAGAALLVFLTASIEAPFATVMVAGIAATIAIAFALAPRGYALEPGHLRIERPLRAIEIPLASIRAAWTLPDDAFRGALRVAGSGGLFGYYGRFWSKRLGAFRLYATRRTGLVVVDTAADRFVLSPEPPERFLDVLLSRAPSASRAPSDAPPRPRPMPRSMKLWLAALVALVPIAVAAILAAIWAFSPVAARVEGGEIHVARKLARTVVIPVADVRRVERVAPQYVRRLRRVGGTSAGAVRYGHFRSPELGDVQLYAWRSDGYVLLDTDDARILVTPDDPDAFVAQVRAAISR
jgi:hypothetical protein